MPIKDFLFPKHCLSCGSIGSYICLDCQEELRYIIKDRCLYCQKKSYLGFTHPRCKRRLGIDGSLSIFYYGGALRKILKSIKYRLVKEAFNEFFQIINRDKLDKYIFLKNLVKKEIFIVPIPLYWQRFNKRGFNQAEVIGSFFSNLLKQPLIKGLERIKNTKEQAKLKTKKERYLNVRGAFKVFNEFKAKTVFLIDDVVTSGTTAKEAGRQLKKKGVRKVFVLSIAKG